jgi:hypothetical protein
MSDQDQLDTIADEREKHPVETIEPLSVDGHLDQLSECFRVVFAWLSEARTSEGIAARHLVLSSALQIDHLTAHQIAATTGVSKAYVSKLIVEVDRLFGITHSSRRRKE